MQLAPLQRGRQGAHITMQQQAAAQQAQAAAQQAAAQQQAQAQAVAAYGLPGLHHLQSLHSLHSLQSMSPGLHGGAVQVECTSLNALHSNFILSAFSYSR
jgi:multidrug efflux pump subunit AcrA (membrane-fusion protein)